MAGRKRGVWLVLGGGTVLGLGVLLYYALREPSTVGLNYRVFHVAAERALAGEAFYGVSPQDSTYAYLYPPVTVLGFAPLAALGEWAVGYLLLSGLSLAASVGAAWLLAAYLVDRGHAVTWPERALLAAYLGVSAHTALSLVYGQVNHLVVAGLVFGLVALERGDRRAAGAVLALPAYVKLLPGVVGLYLLRERAWRAIGAALATAVGLTAVGLVVFGVETHVTYVTEALIPRRDTAAFVGGLDPAAEYVTLRRPLSVLFPGVDPAWYAVGAAAVLLSILAPLYREIETHTDRMIALFGTLAAGLLFFPSLLLYTAYLAFPLVVLLYELPAGRARTLFVTGALLSMLTVSFDGVRQLLGTAPLDGESAATIATLLRPVFALGTPVLYGCLLMLAGCVLYRWEHSGGN